MIESLPSSIFFKQGSGSIEEQVSAYWLLEKVRLEFLEHMAVFDVIPIDRTTSHPSAPRNVAGYRGRCVRCLLEIKTHSRPDLCRSNTKPARICDRCGSLRSPPRLVSSILTVSMLLWPWVRTKFLGYADHLGMKITSCL
jgi:hypothetical protein